MTNSLQGQDSIWSWFEKGIVFVVLVIIISTFAFNFTKYAWTHAGFELYNHFVWWFFDIKIAWGFKSLAVDFVILLIPLSFVSFILLIISIINPRWFKSRFRVKYWYGIFFAQILTWILIANL